MKGMHLLPAYYTTTNTKKRKKKKKTKALIAAEKQHEKFLKRMGVNKPKARVAQTVEQLICNHQVEGSIPSSGTIPTNCPKPEPKVYTGDEIVGIAQMHKSNAVPIRRKQDAVDIAHMRR
tara:strand:- start:247 stop:606 length:360 start_codon:yes stop_codon:yes gene_type:complete